MPIILNVQAYRGIAPVPPIGRRFGLEGGVVGRGAGSDLVLDDPTKYISRAHARVEFRDGGWFLVDIGTNPSLVDGQPLGQGGPARLAGGERIDIGDYALVATVEPEPAKAQSAEPSWLQPMAGQADPVPAPAVVPAAIAPFDQAGDSLAAASIVNMGGPFDTAFDPGADPLGLNLAPLAASSGDGAYRGAVSDHAPPEQAAFVMPRPAAMPAPAIPHDYDPLADLLARPAPAALPPAGSPPLFPPVPQPEPLPAPAAQSVPPAAALAAPPAASLQGVQPETEPAMRTVLRPAVQSGPMPVSPSVLPPDMPPVEATAATAAVPAAMPPAADDSRVLQALLRGLGLPDLHSRRGAE